MLLCLPSQYPSIRAVLSILAANNPAKRPLSLTLIIALHWCPCFCPCAFSPICNTVAMVIKNKSDHVTCLVTACDDGLLRRCWLSPTSLAPSTISPLTHSFLAALTGLWPCLNILGMLPVQCLSLCHPSSSFSQGPSSWSPFPEHLSCYSRSQHLGYFLC